jgi:hypothetical protein
MTPEHLFWAIMAIGMAVLISLQIPPGFEFCQWVTHTVDCR